MLDSQPIRVINPPRFVELARDLAAELKSRFGIPEWFLAYTVEEGVPAIDLAVDPGHPILSDALIPDLLQVAKSHRTPVVIADTAHPDALGTPLSRSALTKTAAVLAEAGVGASVIIPLRDTEGRLLGILGGISAVAVPLMTQPDFKTAVALQGRVFSTLLNAEIVRNAAHMETALVRREAQRDGLTGVLNRAGWEAAVVQESARVKRYGLPATVVLLDLDQMKVTNDRFGHRAGDRLLRRTAQVLQKVYRTNDVIARIGGDEFVVLLIGTDHQAAQPAITRLREQLHRVGVEASIGHADTRVGSIAKAQDVADDAMYADKVQRKGVSVRPV